MLVFIHVTVTFAKYCFIQILSYQVFFFWKVFAVSYFCKRFVYNKSCARIGPRFIQINSIKY